MFIRENSGQLKEGVVLDTVLVEGSGGHMQPENTCRHYSGLERLPTPFTKILLFSVNILLENKKDYEHQSPKTKPTPF